MTLPRRVRVPWARQEAASQERHDAMRASLYAPLTAALLLAMLFLAGCESLDHFKARHGWTEEKMLAMGWLGGRYIPPKTIYCYHTIGRPECFETAQPAERSRLIGYFDDGIAY